MSYTNTTKSYYKSLRYLILYDMYLYNTSWHDNTLTLLGFCDCSTSFERNTLWKQCLFKCKMWIILYFNLKPYRPALVMRFISDYASSISSGRQSTCRWSRIPSGTYLIECRYYLSLKYQKMQTIIPPRPWFELYTFYTKVHRFIALIIIIIIIKIKYIKCIQIKIICK